MKTSLLKVENLSKAYVPSEWVWQGVTFEMKRGDFLYILGGSGAGKSSLLRTLASFEHASEGKVYFEGMDLGKSSQNDLTRYRKRIAYIPQSLGLIPDLSVMDHLEMTRAAVPENDRVSSEQVEALLNLMNLSSKRHQSIASLSGGERQRVAILRALTRKLDLLIADEPTGAQDFEMTWKLMDLFVKQNLQGTAVLLATHDLEMVRRLRKRCAILKDGAFKVEDRA